MTNERGSVIIVAVLILALLSIIGITGLKTSITEQHIATNHQIMHMNFYAAESGAPHGVLWLKGLDLLNDTDTDPFYPFTTADVLDEDGNVIGTEDEQTWFSLNNGTSYTWTVEHQTTMVGGVEKVLYYGDHDGDQIWTVNTTTGVPLETIIAEGTHPRGGLARIQTTWIYSPTYVIPEAALWVSKIVSAAGNVSISGNDTTGECADVAGIKHTLPTTVDDLSIDKIKTLEGTPAYTDPTTGDGLYMHDMSTLIKKADVVIGDQGGAAIDLCDFIGATTADDPALVVITDPDIKLSGNCEGYGMLYTTGNLSITGTVSWHGLVLVDGDSEMKGGGSGIVVDGAMVVNGNTTALLGNVDVQYNCEMLNNINDNLSGYRMTSWRQM